MRETGRCIIVGSLNFTEQLLFIDESAKDEFKAVPIEGMNDRSVLQSAERCFEKKSRVSLKSMVKEGKMAVSQRKGVISLNTKR